MLIMGKGGRGRAGMSETVIVAGGDFDPEGAEKILETGFVIGADRGALYLTDLGYRVDLALGDFDSVTEAEFERIEAHAERVIRHPSKKNDTDLELAVKTAMEREGNVTILGATGSRLDQTVSAIELLKRIFDGGKDACIMDKNNRISCISGTKKIEKRGFSYVSLMPCGDGPVRVNLRGFKYSGEGIILEKGSSLGISNEIESEEGVIESDGCLYLYETRD